MANHSRPCSCGSGQESWWHYDARGIELCRVCPDCRTEKLKRYRPEVLTNPNYEADEPMEPEDEINDWADRAHQAVDDYHDDESGPVGEGEREEMLNDAWATRMGYND